MNIRKSHSVIVTFVSLFLLLAGCFSLLWAIPARYAQAADLSSLPRSISIREENHKTSYKLKSVPEITYNGAKVSPSFPLMQIDQVWMAAGEQFFRDQLGFGYLFDQEKKQITMKNPALDMTMVFTVGSSQAQFNGESLSLDYPVVKAKDVETGTTAYLLPLQNILKKSGMILQISGSQLSITDDLIFHKVVLLDESLDTSKYNNVLEGLYVKKTKVDGERMVHFTTIHTLSDKQVTFQELNGTLAVQITFPKTKNLLGEWTQKFSGGAVTQLDIREDASCNTIVTLQYGMKYIYTKKFSGSSLTTTFTIAKFDLRIPLPEKASFSKVSATDQYWNNRFLIIIPGNHVSFYKSNTPIKNHSQIKSVKVAKTAEGNTKITVTTKKLQGYRLHAETSNRYFTVDIGSPKSIYKNIVMLDAGHGGKDKGATKNGLKEKKLNYTILYTKAKKYFEGQDSNVKAYWTRHTDKFINLYQRPKYSAQYHADLFVSLHMNSGKSSANGTEVYYSRNNNKKNGAGLTSRTFAKKMLSTITTDLGTSRRGVKQAGFVVIKHNTVPSVLVELGFVSSKKDSRNLRKSSYQTRAAKSIYRGISNVFRSYPTKR